MANIPTPAARDVHGMVATRTRQPTSPATLRARHVSRERVRGRWWRTLALSALVWLVSGAPGPLLASLVMLTGLVSLDGAQLVSSLIYAVSFGIAIIATTVYYQHLDDIVVVEGRAAAGPPAQGSPGPVPDAISA